MLCRTQLPYAIAWITLSALLVAVCAETQVIYAPYDYYDDDGYTAIFGGDIHPAYSGDLMAVPSATPSSAKKFFILIYARDPVNFHYLPVDTIVYKKAKKHWLGIEGIAMAGEYMATVAGDEVRIYQRSQYSVEDALAGNLKKNQDLYDEIASFESGGTPHSISMTEKLVAVSYVGTRPVATFANCDGEWQRGWSMPASLLVEVVPWPTEDQHSIYLGATHYGTDDDDEDDGEVDDDDFIAPRDCFDPIPPMTFTALSSISTESSSTTSSSSDSSSSGSGSVSQSSDEDGGRGRGSADDDDEDDDDSQRATTLIDRYTFDPEAPLIYPAFADELISYCQGDSMAVSKKSGRVVLGCRYPGRAEVFTPDNTTGPFGRRYAVTSVIEEEPGFGWAVAFSGDNEFLYVSNPIMSPRPNWPDAPHCSIYTYALDRDGVSYEYADVLAMPNANYLYPLGYYLVTDSRTNSTTDDVVSPVPLTEGNTPALVVYSGLDR